MFPALAVWIQQTSLMMATGIMGRWFTTVFLIRCMWTAKPTARRPFGGCNEEANSEPPWVMNIGYGFTGRIDEFGFWNSALTPAQISAVMTLGSGATDGNPLLAIICSANQTVLSWAATPLHLQMNTNLNNQAGWTDVVMGTNSPVILTIGANSTFYRLSNP
jgi:hypothetical protein